MAAEAKPRIDVIVNQLQPQISPESMPAPGLTFGTAWLKGRTDRVNAALPTFDYAADVLPAVRTVFAHRHRESGGRA
jgi:hypothetical protein